MAESKDLKETKTTKAKSTKTKEVNPVEEKSELEQYKAMVEALTSKVENLTKEKELISEKSRVEKDSTPVKRLSMSKLKGEDIWLVRDMGGIGSVAYKDKTGYTHIWSERGDQDYVDGEELQKMKKGFLNDGTLRIVDRPDVVEALGLTKVYQALDTLTNENIVKNMEMKELYNMVEGLDKKFKNTMAINVANAISNGEIGNINVINKLGQVLDKDFAGLEL